jgi:hypothetical protein
MQHVETTLDAARNAQAKRNPEYGVSKIDVIWLVMDAVAVVMLVMQQKCMDRYYAAYGAIKISETGLQPNNSL